MCGICGFSNLDGSLADRALLDRMVSAMRHRGPDGHGVFVDAAVALGHTRLSIIDLATGAQPLGNEDGAIQVTFNGEIYNYVELREELLAAGHQFRTRSDTEVIVHAYEEWGLDCVSRFNGMFAFAIWDARTQRLFIARDHLGIKPLYFARSPSRFIFASEIKALLQDENCTGDMDLDALTALFTFRYVPSPKTLFRGIEKLPPGHHLVVSGHGITITRYWRSTPHHRNGASEADLIDEYQHLLKDAVRLQLRSDVPLGLFLSSGIDSSVILALMRECGVTAPRTFTIGFESGEATNETADAAGIAALFGAEHTSTTVTPRDYADYYERYMRDLEEPVGHEAAAAFYFVARATRSAVKVALCGQGADEPWAGYQRHLGAKYSSIYSRLPASITRAIARIATATPGRLERLKRGVLSLSERDPLLRLAKVYSFFNADMKAQLFRPDVFGALTDPFASRLAIKHLVDDVRGQDALTQMLYVDTRASLPDDLLMVGDKTSMANSLEVRVPLLDVRLVEFIENLPPHLKLSGRTGKYLHKKAVTKWLPKEIVYRKKKGFSLPIGHWLRTSMRPLIQDCLLSPDTRLGAYFDQRYIADVVDRDYRGLEEHTRHIYLLLSLELWLRAFSRSPASL